MASATSVPIGGAVIGGTAPVEVGSGDQGARVPADLVVLWDFDNDGDFDEPDEDITPQLVEFETQTGRDFPSQLTGRAGPGQLRLIVRNDDDRYSYFNAGSPLNADPFSLRVGRKIRVQTSDTLDVDPVLLVRDRFDRPNGHPAFTETGQAWSLLGAGAVLTMSIVNRRLKAVETGRHLAGVDVNVNDYYTQVALAGPVDGFGDNWAGILARFVDFDNYVFARAWVNELELVERVAGVDTVLGSYTGATGSFRWWPGFTLGLSVDGTQATVYACGVPVITDTLTGSTGDRTGLIFQADDVGTGNVHEPVRALFDDFYVFDRTATPVDGVLFTGRVTGVRPASPVGGNKRAMVEAEGVLANAAVSRVVSSRSRGAATGILVGDALAKAGLLHPPGSIAHGTITTGPVTLDDGKALEVARQFEATEFGFLHESPHGTVDFHDRAHRDGASPAVTFSDLPGAQYQYAEITPLDQRHDIVNRVTAGVAPELPDYFSGLVTTDSNSTAAGVANHVDVTMPTVEPGDALLVVIASTVAASGVGWHNPIWWGNLREFQGRDEDAIRTRVYFHPCDGSESGTTVRFYTNTGTLGGAWIAKIIRIRSWWEGPQGTSDVSFVAGDNPPFLAHGWGRTPVLFIAVNAGLTSVGGGSLNLATFQFPEGYDTSSTTINGTVNGFDVGLHVACRLDVAESDNPTPFGGLEGYAILESGTLAVRGFDGDHLLLPTLKNPSQFQATPGRFVTVDDLQSQLDLRVIRSHELAPNLFADETAAQAYGDAVIADFRDDRPIFAIRFPATLSALHREQAIVRRVGDLIHLVANSDTGMGVSAPFFIEAIGHEVTDAGKRWWVTWELSPA